MKQTIQPGSDPVVQPFREQAGGRPILVVNGDNDHYFKAGCMKTFVPVEERIASADGARRYLDAITEGGKVTHYFACANGQRASYDSKACDPIWMAVDEAKARGIEPNEWPLNAKRMRDAGFDCYSVWCEYGRKKGVSVWISQRMNDVHNVDLEWNIRTNRFWYDHPELRREPGTDGNWTRHALDYSKPAVQDFSFGIFRELVDRYDADGFELDFMRFWEHLTPGREREQAPILTAFIRRCRDYANEKAKARGHAILLSTRVPSSYEAALAFGYDPETWAREGLVDMIAVANFWAGADYDFDFAGWRGRLEAANPAVTVLPCVCDNVSCTGEVAAVDGPALAGWADNAFTAGAEGVYFFNTAYLPDDVQRSLYTRGCTPETVRAAARRYLPAFHDCVPEGMDDGHQLPIALASGGTVHIRVGTAAGAACSVVVALDADRPPPPLTLNGAAPCGAPVREENLKRFARNPAETGVVCGWRVPFAAGTLQDGMNAVSLASEEAGGARVLWCEIEAAALGPDGAAGR